MRAISDITWPQEFLELKRMEDELQCGICYEFLDVTLMTPCSHNYCSRCIRKYLHYKTECPKCFKQTFDKDLRINKCLDLVVSHYLSVRDKIGQCVTGKKINIVENVTQVESPPGIKLFGPRDEVATESPPVRPVRISQLIKTPKRETEISPQKSVSLKEPEPVPVSKPALEKSFNTEPPQTPKPEPAEKPIAKIFSSPSTSNQRNHKISDFFASPKNVAPKAVIMVPCPVCAVDVSETNINRHLDDCLKRQQTSKEEVTKESQKRRPLAKLVLNMMKDAELKRKLREFGLAVSGDRRALEARYHRYVTLYNSECDKPNPRPVNELVKQCEHEETQELKSKSLIDMGIKLQVNRNSSPNLIEEEQKKYRERNKSIFNSLIEDVKKRNCANTESSSSNSLAKEEVSSNVSMSDDGDVPEFFAMDDVFNDSDSSSCPLQRYDSSVAVGRLNNLLSNASSPLRQTTPVKPVNTPMYKSASTPVKQSTPSSSKIKSVYDQTTDSDSSASEQDMFESSEKRPINKKQKLSEDNVRRSLTFKEPSSPDLPVIDLTSTIESAKTNSLRKRTRMQNATESSVSGQVDSPKKVLHESNDNKKTSETGAVKRSRGRPRGKKEPSKETEPENLPKRPIRKVRYNNKSVESPNQ